MNRSDILHILYSRARHSNDLLDVILDAVEISLVFISSATGSYSRGSELTGENYTKEVLDVNINGTLRNVPA